jgi:AraC-like DNA-binding protein
MTDPPENIAHRPDRDGLELRGQPYDLLSELLRSVRLTGENIAAYGPGRGATVSFPASGAVHLVDEGELTLRVDGQRSAERLGRGDIVLLPRGDAHRISDAGGRTGASARWLCGTFTIGDPRASHLLASLPAVIVLRGGDGPALEGLQVAHRMLLIEMESPTQGSAVMIARILDVVLIQILRLWAAGPHAGKNWLAGALDPQIGPALSAIHRDPDHGWTVEELARECSLSRSAFAERFSARLGTPPATYLAHVRLDAATDLLRGTGLPMTVIAKRVGYTSEAAFSRAFSNRYGTPPARWRRSQPLRG